MVPHVATTVSEHRPKAHQRYLEWTPSRLVDWAKKIGPATAELLDRIMASKRHPEQGYRSCLGILRLSKQYTTQRVEAAARRAIVLPACSYPSIKSILKCHLDKLQAIEPTAEAPCRRSTTPTFAARNTSTPVKSPPSNESEGIMLIQPTIEKLCAMRLRGMAEAFEQQQQDANIHSLSFEERLGLLIDRQWNWRQNRALDRRLRNGRLRGWLERWRIRLAATATPRCSSKPPNCSATWR